MLIARQQSLRHAVSTGFIVDCNWSNTLRNYTRHTSRLLSALTLTIRVFFQLCAEWFKMTSAADEADVGFVLCFFVYLELKRIICCVSNKIHQACCLFYAICGIVRIVSDQYTSWWKSLESNMSLLEINFLFFCETENSKSRYRSRGS